MEFKKMLLLYCNSINNYISQNLNSKES